MPRILCKIHGNTGAPLVCTHIADLIQSRTSFDLPFCVSADHLAPFVFGVHLCAECAAKYGFSDAVTKLEGESGLDRIFEIDDQTPVCNTCFTECCRARVTM
jgi:hypothetical protein